MTTALQNDVPVTVAADFPVMTEDVLKDAIAESGEVTLGADIVLQEELKIRGNVKVTLDLSGHKLSGEELGSTKSPISVSGGAELIMESVQAYLILIPN